MGGESILIYIYNTSYIYDPNNMQRATIMQPSSSSFKSLVVFVLCYTIYQYLMQYAIVAITASSSVVLAPTTNKRSSLEERQEKYVCDDVWRKIYLYSRAIIYYKSNIGNLYIRKIWGFRSSSLLCSFCELCCRVVMRL